MTNHVRKFQLDSQVPIYGEGGKALSRNEKKGAWSRIKDGIKAVLSKIKSGMKSLANKIKSSFRRKLFGEEVPTKIMIVERESGFVGVQYVSEEKKPGLFSRTKTKVANMWKAIANKGYALWNAITRHKKKNNKEQDLVNDNDKILMRDKDYTEED